MTEKSEAQEGTKIDGSKTIPPKRTKFLIAATIIIVLIATGVAVVSLNGPQLKSNQPVAITIASSNSSSVTIPQTTITETATWYQYSVNGTWVRFFAVKDSAGTVHTAFDECPNCYSSHQGFRQEGTSMVENCCNMGIKVTDITKAGCSGGECHPVFLPSQVADGNLTISTADISAGVYLFR
jgi:uncharacterized membrane protein